MSNTICNSGEELCNTRIDCVVVSFVGWKRFSKKDGKEVLEGDLLDVSDDHLSGLLEDLFVTHSRGSKSLRSSVVLSHPQSLEGQEYGVLIGSHVSSSKELVAWNLVGRVGHVQEGASVSIRVDGQVVSIDSRTCLHQSVLEGSQSVCSPVLVPVNH